MNNYVVVIKTHKDVPKGPGDLLHPDEWPAECEEFPTIEAAAEKYPDSKVWAIPDYKHFQQGLSFAHSLIPRAPDFALPKKPWWKFWGAK